VKKKEDTRRKKMCKEKMGIQVKRNAIFRKRLVACGFCQVPGIYFTESSASVFHDVLFRIILIEIMVWNLKAKITDTDSESLNSDLEQSMFMEIQYGMEVNNGKCLFLENKKLYRLVQIARQFYVQLVKALKSCGFTGSLVDPCLWVKNSNSGIVMMAISMDNCLTIVSDDGIKEVIEDLKK
jgi:hypothetical protein